MGCRFAAKVRIGRLTATDAARARRTFQSMTDKEHDVSLTYGFVKAKIKSVAGLKASRSRSETQYHIHLTLSVQGGDWDVAINVGTNDSDDLLKYKLVYDFAHPLTDTLLNAREGFTDLTDTDALPALDFLRSDVLANTGRWRDSDVMDGTQNPEPIPSVMRLVNQAMSDGQDLYVFGRTYTTGGSGIHDTHMNQGSMGTHFKHVKGNDSTDHNDIWQDGGLLVDSGKSQWTAYFAVFEQQRVPTDDLGNPEPDAEPVDDSNTPETAAA
jgi:uncharacterized protein YukJ